MEPGKGPVTRAALERVLARAAELQSASGESTDTTDALSESQVVELGREVGLSPAHLQQALAEERARIAPGRSAEGGLAHSLFGGSRVDAQRVVPGTPARLLDLLDRWMQRDELLRSVRVRPDARVWEPISGFVGSLRRAFGSRDYALFRANEISATVVPVDSATSLVRIEADYGALRSSLAKQSAAGIVVGSGVAGIGVMLAVAIPVAVAVLPGAAIAAGTYYRSRGVQRHALYRAQLTLEQILDRLERGETQTPSLLKIIESALPPSR
jgi:hypothetical protein